MKANEVLIKELLSKNKTKFVIPVYQRNYNWKQEHCKQLLQDIENAAEKFQNVENIEKNNTHFIGSIVYLKDGLYTSQEIEEFIIIDGQQRLTTITIMYIVLWKLATKLNNKKLADDISIDYLQNRVENEHQKAKLRVTANNQEIFLNLFSDEPKLDSRGFSSFVDNYKFFENYINKDNYENIYKGLNRLIILEVVLEKGKDDPQRIFESMNSTGLELSQADLIRNYVLMDLEAKQQEEFYNKYWCNIESLTHNPNNKDETSNFIKCYLMIDSQRNKIAKDKIYANFKEEYNDETKKCKALVELTKFASYYNKLLNPTNNEKDIQISQQLAYINKLEVTVSYPFLLKVYDDYANKLIDKNCFIQVLNLIQSLVFRRYICGLPSNTLTPIFKKLYDEINNLDDYTKYIECLQYKLLQLSKNEKFPDDEEFKQNFKNKPIYNDKIRTKYILHKLELFNNKEPINLDNNYDDINISIEHIFPQNPDNEWFKSLFQEEIDNIKNKYLHTIANLTLSGTNTQLSNKNFTDKKQILQQYSNIALNKYLLNLNKWDIEELNKRFEHLFEKCLNIWQYPNHLKAKINKIDEEINIFEADNPTHKKLEFAILFDEKIEIKDMVGLYGVVMKKLFENHEEVFFSNQEIKEITKITNDKTQLRYVIEISPAYFIEGHFSNETKFRNLKKIIKLLNLDEDVLKIKYLTLNSELV